jgi:hypothetical protein
MPRRLTLAAYPALSLVVASVAIPATTLLTPAAASSLPTPLTPDAAANPASPPTLVTASVASTATTASATPPGNMLSSLALGLNTAPWNTVYAGRYASTIQKLLRTAGIGLLRYGDGSTSDEYDWQTNSDIAKCLPGNPAASFKVTGRNCAESDALGFDQFSEQSKAARAQTFVTINYGSGTPALAAAWVRHSQDTRGEGVALWEVGNEGYGCWEVNNWLARPPESYRQYRVDDFKTCPQVTEGNAAGTQTLATSYADNALPFLKAMKQADPSARIGVPWAFGPEVPGATVPDNAEWNSTVLSKDGRYVSFVDAHWYPFIFGGRTGGRHPTDQQVLRSLMPIPSDYADIRAGLDKYAPHAAVIIGETNVSIFATQTACTATGALFAAGDVLSWLAAGAQSVDWWDMNNYGNTGAHCTHPDFGMISSGSPPGPQAPYDGYLLASVLAQPHARLAAMATSDPADVLAYQSLLPNGTEAVAFINTNTHSAETVSFTPDTALRGNLKTWTYSAAHPEINTSTATAAHHITLPAESMVILSH